ncbi:MAG: hypothetical protein A2857_03100 [Candidatus Levybacteria bacterium RIFCSPHIGHO2_01_FULL_36_15]|nr:MAG: hypothetical protein A2857_03100 [Candidatus Levybacteria bacterium RIFCSPHIGHO2_01_FULL_36_15]OGH38237.1 MAG: hypothetical protein A2905_03330 [Candidatus Levybacteria bacterium RIFCSPLOWO2_01_FULL_36_10]
MNLDLWFRGLTFLIFGMMRLYWYLVKHRACFNKQKSQNKSSDFEKIGMIVCACFIGMNLLGFTVFTFENIIFQSLGLILVVLGCGEAIIGRKILGTNWTESYEYQVKKEQQLVTEGVYKYIRHPIYGGLMIATTGAFIVAKTYLFIPVLVFK